MKVLVSIAALWLIASVLCVLPQAASASNQIAALLRQAEEARTSDAIRFRQFLQQVENRKGEATAAQLEQLSYLEAYKDAYAGRYALAVERAQKLIDTSSDVNVRYRAGALAINTHAVAGRFTEGLRQLEKTLPLTDAIDDPELRNHGLAVAAQIYSAIGQHDLGLRYAEQILSGTVVPRTQCFATQYRLEALQNLKKLPPDDGPILNAISLCVGQHELIVANLLRGTLARKWAEQGRYDEAIVLIRGRLAEAEATRFPRLIGEMHSLLAELLLGKNDFEAADSHAQAAIAQSESLASSLALVAAYKTRYEVAAHRHDAVAALALYRSYAEADRAYFNDVKARELAYHIVRQESQQKAQQIELLKGENQLLQLQQRVGQQAAQNTRLMVLLLLLLVAAIGYWAYKVKNVQMSLRRFAETDALTDISNRHHFTQRAEQALAQSAKDGEPCALVMFDLDHFKVINDSYGHITGDWVLQRVAQTCKAHCRGIDHLGRLGGEEFAILLHGGDLRAATRLAEDCRVQLTQIDTRESGYTFVVTASFGISATPLSGYSLAKLLSNADQMLYSAKRAGRNCVHAFTGDPLSPPQLQVVSRNDELSTKREETFSSEDVEEGLRS